MTKKQYYQTLQFLSICLTLMLSGCSGIKYQSHKINPEFNAGNKAIVITSVGHKYKGLILSGDIKAAFSFARVDSNYPDVKTKHAYYDDPNLAIFSHNYAFMMIEPGTYVMEAISYSLGDTNYYSTLAGLNPGTEHFVYGGFTVKPGEIVYIGNIDINLGGKPGDGMLAVYDNYEDAMKAFHKKYPEFSKCPVNKRLFEPNGKL